MGSVYRVTNTLKMKSGVAKDAAVNVHHIYSAEDGTVDEVVLALWATELSVFYEDCNALWSPAVQTTGTPHTITIAKMATGAPGANDDIMGRNLFETSYGITSSGVPGALPPEVAICLSHQGEILGAPEEAGSTRPRSRRRGRSFLGPLNTGCATTDGPTGKCVVSEGIINIILASFETLVMTMSGYLEASHRGMYGVYSATADTFYSALEAHVDNAFDTQRRRGIAATSRTTIALDPLIRHVGDVSEVD